MRVIILEDIKDLGKKYDVKDVSDGYARNSLIPSGKVKIADEKSLEWLKMQKEILLRQAEENLEEIQKTASAMDGLELLISTKIGDEGQLFEKITVQKISEKLKEMGYAINKTQIELEKPIEEIGEFSVKVKFPHNLESEVMIVITEEK